jgi:hypothetical protein
MYRAPVWIEAMKYAYNRRKYIRVQRLINLRIDHTFCTTSNEALCVLAGTIPIIIKVEVVVNIHNIKIGEETKRTRDREVEPKYWQHPADDAKIIEAKEHKDQTIHSYMQN